MRFQKSFHKQITIKVMVKNQYKNQFRSLFFKDNDVKYVHKSMLILWSRVKEHTRTYMKLLFST